MSLFSSVILPQLEKSLEAKLPGLSGVLLEQLGNIANELIQYIKEKEDVKIKPLASIGEI